MKDFVCPGFLRLLLPATAPPLRLQVHHAGPTLPPIVDLVYKQLHEVPLLGSRSTGQSISESSFQRA